MLYLLVFHLHVYGELHSLIITCLLRAYSDASVKAHIQVSYTALPTLSPTSS